VLGQPTRFIWGHVIKKPGSSFAKGRERENAQRAAATVERDKRIVELHNEGLAWDEIAERLGTNHGVVAQVIFQARHRDGQDVPYRNTYTSRYVDEDLAQAISELWSEDDLTVPAIAKRMGWTRRKGQAVIAALRRAGYKLDRRKGCMVELSTDERRAVVRAYKKRKAQPVDRMRPRTQMILRLLEAAKRPVTVTEIAAFLWAAGEQVTTKGLNANLYYMAKIGVIGRAETGHQQWFERGIRWFIPLGAEQPKENLTLADAERETELAALIEAQEDELKRGDWTDSEKGHWADKSIDAPLTADGFTILDTLGSEDENFAELAA
jgi:transposase